MERSERESDIEESSSKVPPEAKTHSAFFHTMSSHHPKEGNYPQDIQDIHSRIMLKPQFPILNSFYSDRSNSILLYSIL